MKIDRIILSVFTKENDVIRLSIDKKIVYAILIIAFLPYAYFSTIAAKSMYEKIETRKIALAPAPKPKILIDNSIKKISQSPLIIQDIKVRESSIERNEKYKFENQKTNWNGDNLEINFNFTKLKIDNHLSSGHLSLVAVGTDGKVIAESDKSYFKFTFSRASKFKLKGIKKESVENLRLKISESDHISYLNLTK